MMLKAQVTPGASLMTLKVSRNRQMFSARSLTCCVPSVNRERTLAFKTLQKWRPCAAAGRAAVRRTVLCARDALSGHDAEAPRRVAARRSVEMIKLAGGAFRRLLEARLTYSSPKVRARRSCTNPRCPQLRSPHVRIASALV